MPFQMLDKTILFFILCCQFIELYGPSWQAFIIVTFLSSRLLVPPSFIPVSSCISYFALSTLLSIFIHSIYIALLRGSSDTARILCRCRLPVSDYPRHLYYPLGSLKPVSSYQGGNLRPVITPCGSRLPP